VGNLYREHVSESHTHPEALWFVNIMIITAYVPREEDMNLRQEEQQPLV